MSKLQPVRGTHDILPQEAAQRRAAEQALAQVCALYGYGEIQTPVFEFSDVFHRTLGDTSDVVTKETYTFTDRGGESITLRPEFTAGVVRALISNGLQEQLPFKVWYHGPAFRYERPQKGRLRQFHQFGAECIGAESPLADVQMIAMANQALAAIGVAGATVLEINSLGDAQSRLNYRAALVTYFNSRKNLLSEDSKMRLEKNPLRILDSKDENDRQLIASAPRGHDYFTSEAKDFFAEVQESLSMLGIAHQVNPRLVRGLDYYSHTVFEFTTEALGSQGTVLAGGRYDRLVAMMGGHNLPGVGFAAGMERLLALQEALGVSAGETARVQVAVVPVDEPQERAGLELAQMLRAGGIASELITRGNMGKKMKRAEKTGAAFVAILGETELQTGHVVLKTLADGKQEIHARSDLVQYLKTL